MSHLYGTQRDYLLIRTVAYLLLSVTAVLTGVILGYIIISVIFENLALIGTFTGLISIALFFIPFLSTIWLLHRLHKSLDQKGFFYFSGLIGEEKILKQLTRLDDRFSVFQDAKLPGRRDNIDFIVLGPGGVFTIEVKSHKGRISFDGSSLLRNGRVLEKDFLKQARGQALGLHDHLLEKTGADIWVKPIIVFTGTYLKIPFGHNEVGGCRVYGKEWLVNALEISPAVASWPVSPEIIESNLLLLTNYKN